MIKNKYFLKKLISHIPILNKFIRKIYFNFKDIAYFIPFDFEKNVKDIIKTNTFRLDSTNFNKLNKSNEFFLVFREKSIKNY